jgi:hypothetical protein
LAHGKFPPEKLPRCEKTQSPQLQKTVPQYQKSPGCHAERERSICFSDTLRKADSSPAAQNNIAIQTPSRGVHEVDWKSTFPIPSPDRRSSSHDFSIIEFVEEATL